MDRTSWLGVIVCVTLLFVWGWWNAKETARQLAEQAEAARNAPPVEQVEPGSEKTDSGKKTETTPAGTSAAEVDPSAVAPEEVTLSNEVVTYHLTNKGASIQTVELKEHNRHLDPADGKITINRTSKNGIGALSPAPGQFDQSIWTVVSKDASQVTFATDTPDKLHIEKTYRLAADGTDPYEILLEISIRNDTGTPIQTGKRFLYAGAAGPLHLNEWSMQIGFYWMDGTEFESKNVDHFGGKKVMGIFGKDKIPHDEFTVESVQWAGVNDQFFTTLIKPENPYAATLWASRYPVVVENNPEESEKKKMSAAEAALGLPDLAMNPGDKSTLQYRIYTGPKEYSRLASYDDERRRVMNYDQIPIFGWMFGWAIKPLASILIWGLVHLKGVVGGYGSAIILITILIRLLIWPVYAKSARSMKRMSKLTPKMQELREKYKDDPQRMNQETMKLYKTYGVNPLGGCLPMFIQLPVFLAFYRMLWSAVELRHESFLWVSDLSMPDTLFEVFGIPINPLPILMACTTFVQMAITPKTGDKTQQMIFMLMPFIFLFICYNFAAALSLYWTTSNAFSILQTWLMNKLPEPELKKKAASGKKGFFERLQEQAEAQQKARAGGSGGGGGGKSSSASPMSPGSRTKLASEKGDRHTKSKKKKKR